MAKLEGAKNFDFPNMVSIFGGYVSSVDKTRIAENVLVEGSVNVYKKLSGTIAVREGQLRRGDANTTISPISSEFVWNTSWGATYNLVVSDSKLYVVIGTTWYVLLSSLTSTRYVFDKWWDNTEKKDRAVFVNGSDDLFHWSGGYAVLSTKTVNTLTKTGSTSWAQAGFSTTSGEKTVVINGTTYTYTGGETTTVLTGVTPDPTGEANGSTVLQSVITTTNKPASGFENDFLKVINNQVYIGSYTSRLIYISKATDFKDYTVPTPRAPGDPEILTLDGTGKGIGVRQGKAHIGFGSGSWAVVTFTDITVGSTLTQQTSVSVKPVALQQAPYAHEFIDTVGDSLIYLAQDQQVRSFGDFNNLYTPGYPSFSQEVATELSAEDFTAGSLKCIGEFVYVCAPASGKVYLYQTRNLVDPAGNVVAERLWHAPFIWSVTAVDEVDGVIVGYSNANPQIYQLWDTNQWFDDSPSEEELPYRCVAAFGYRSRQNRAELQEFDKLYTEGYISAGTTLLYNINYNYQGATAMASGFINSDTIGVQTYSTQNPDSLGDASLGDNPLGDSTETENISTLAKFKSIVSLSLVNCFEYQPIYTSDSAYSQWELLAIATNAEKATEQATFLIKKPR